MPTPEQPSNQKQPTPTLFSWNLKPVFLCSVIFCALLIVSSYEHYRFTYGLITIDYLLERRSLFFFKWLSPKKEGEASTHTQLRHNP